MKEKNLKIIRQAASILKKDRIAKACEDYCFGCHSCLIARTIQEFCSMIEDFIESDEQMERYMKKFDKIKKK